jgi:hypothetical protein
MSSSPLTGLPSSLSQRKPATPAVSESARIAVFEAFISSAFPAKATVAIASK